MKLKKENRISGLQKGKFRRRSSAPEARKERSYGLLAELSREERQLSIMGKKMK